MTERQPQTGSNTAAIVFAVFAVVCVAAFLANRGSDVGQLPKLIGTLGGGPLFGDNSLSILFSGLTTLALGTAWLGVGTLILSLFGNLRGHSPRVDVINAFAIGAAVWSIGWCFLGIAGAYSRTAAFVAVIVGFLCLFLSAWIARRSEADEVEQAEVASIEGTLDSSPPEFATFDKILVAVISIPVVLSFIAALAPPVAKDALLYHFALPKAFVAQGSNAFIEGNIASYLALGTEMHVVWARLFSGEHSADAASGAVTWMFFPLLLVTIFRWARDTGISTRWSLVATLMVAAVPTAFHVASSGYVDLALAFFITLAVWSLCQWWRSPDRQSILLVAIYLGAALSIKLTAVFVVVGFALIILLRARSEKVPAGSQGTGPILAGGIAALVLAGVLASPWYVRNWAATGSPVFPFYMSIWKGAAEGWDVERSSLFQAMNSQYGGADVNAVNYLIAPLRVSVAAQPENPPLYDGVLGPMFLIGLPLLIWALWKREVAVEVKIASGVAGVMFLFWLFSSQQLRYLLPIVPAVALAIAAAVEVLSQRFDDPLRKAAKFSLAGASAICIATSFAWFCQKAPLRVVLGGETRDQYLSRNLDYYPYYQLIKRDTAADAKVWLINMRRDTYNIDRSVFSDYLFEDWTLRKLVWESRSVQELKAKAAAMNVQYVLTRHDFLFDYDKSTLVDDKKPRPENEAKLRIAKDFILEPANTLRADNKFSLIKVF